MQSSNFNLIDFNTNDLDNQTSSSSFSKPLIFAIIISLLTHLVLAILLTSYMEQNKTRKASHSLSNNTINVSFLTQSERMKSVQKIKQQQKKQNNIAIKKTDVLTRKQEEGLNKKSNSQTQARIVEKIPQLKKKNIKANTSKKFITQDIYDDIQEYLEPAKSPQIKYDFSSSPIYIQKEFDAIIKQRQEIEKINALKQIRKDNEYYEYKSNVFWGVVRRNGNCYIVPEKDPFSDYQKDWTFIGNCEKKKKLTFKPSPSSYKYKEYIEKERTKSEFQFDD